MPQIDYSIVSSISFWTSTLLILFYCILVCLILPSIFFLLQTKKSFILMLNFYKNYLNNFSLFFTSNIYTYEFINKFYERLIIIINILPKKKNIKVENWFYMTAQRRKTKILFSNLSKVFKLENFILKRL